MRKSHQIRQPSSFSQTPPRSWPPNIFIVAAFLQATIKNPDHPLHLRITRATLHQRHEANFVVFTVCEKTTSPSKHSRESRRLRGRVRRRPFLTGWPTCEELSCGSNTLQASSSSSSPAGAAFASLPLCSPILQHVQRHVQIRSIPLPGLV